MHWYANVEGKDIVFEFNGNHHYSPFKILLTEKNEVLTILRETNSIKSLSYLKSIMQPRDYALYLFQDLAKEKLGKFLQR